MIPATTTNYAHDDDYFNQFKNYFDILNQDLLGEFRKLYPDLPEQAFDHLKRMAEYNVPHGKLNRGLLVLEAYKEMIKGRVEPDANLESVFCVGWCVEWLQAFFLVADDVMDSSLSRRGQPCWFRQPNIGLMAVNDALILKSSLNLIIKKRFDQQCLKLSAALGDLFREVETATEIGQLLDMSNNHEAIPDSELLQHYHLITKYKTSLYSFYLPFACAYLLAHHNRSPLPDLQSELAAEREILLQIGHLFQVQDDILDVYGDPEITGKIGRDIEEGKCTWLRCRSLASDMALSDPDRLLIKTSRDTEKVKQIYDRLNMKAVFDRFEAETTARIAASISNLPKQSSSSRILNLIMNKIVKRIK